MKKTSLIFVCVLLSVFCFSGVSYSETDMDLLLRYQETLFNNREKSTNNTYDIDRVVETTKNYTHTIMFNRLIISQYFTLWIYDLISYFSHTYYDKFNQSKMIISRLSYIQKKGWGRV